MFFREVNGQSHLAFIKDYAGRRIIVTDLPIFVFQPMPTLKNETLNLGIVIFAVVVLALTLLFWPVNAMLRWHYGYRDELSSRYRRLRFWMRWVSIADLIFLGSFAYWLSLVEDNIALLSDHFDPKLHAMQAVGLLGALGTLIAIIFCLRSWQSEGLWFWTKIWNTLLMLACLGYVFFVLNWHMLNFVLNY
jgi:multisubunit Na+/H+ antiporter MnhG subunit